MEKASKINLDETVKKLTENEIGILLLEADEKSMFDLLAEKSTHKDRHGMFGDGCNITYHLYPLLYRRRAVVVKPTALTQARAEALYNVFGRWNELGRNKRHAKDPFACKAFQKYLEEIGYKEADYLLLLVP